MKKNLTDITPSVSPLPTQAGDVTADLAALAAGEPGASERVMLAIYARLRALAEHQMQREGAGHTLQPTALVHEAYLKLVDQRDAKWQSRAQFMAVAAEAMRRLLIDHARRRNAAKRGGERQRVPLDGADIPSTLNGIDLLALDDAMARLAVLDPLGTRIIEMRFFGGMEIEHIATVLGIADRTVRRHWVFARAWLSRELSPDNGPAGARA